MGSARSRLNRRTSARWTSPRGVALTVLGACAGLATPAVAAPIPLNYNFNGMASPSEIGQPDSADGFRSISDRALYLDGAFGSFGSPATGETGIVYTVNTTPLTLDIVHLGNRSAGGWPYDLAADGDDIGIQPSWDTSPDHTGPQTTTLVTPVEMFGNTQLGFLYQISNGGGSFEVVLGFTDGSSASATLAGPDWYNLPAVAAPGPGVSIQSRLGGTNWPATTTNDTANVGVVPTNNLSVIEGVISIAKLLADGRGNHAGKSLSSITFRNAVYTGSNARAYAIIAASVEGSPSAVPGGVGTVSPNPAAAGQPAVLSVGVFRATGAPNAITGVTLDGSSIGLASSIALNDAGANGDAVAGDSVYSAGVTIPASAPANASLPFTITDQQNRTGSGTLNFNIVIPPAATDFGTLANAVSTFNGTQDPQTVKWLRFTLASDVSAGAGTFLDIDTEGSSLTGGQFPNDTMLGLYNSAGNRIVTDDDDGSDYYTQLTFGSATPDRPVPGNGLAYNGRDGSLPAGTYYLAYTAFASTFNATNWSVTTTTAHAGSYVINFNTNAGGAPACPSDLDDDGSFANGGNPDGAVTIDDLLFFLVAFEEGNTAADLDNGTGTGTRDDAVTVDDLLFFLVRFEEGC